MNSLLPKVTVLMPVYNGETHLREAMDSILDQSFREFEFLIINDGSTDNSVKIVEQYTDKRIKLIHSRKNTGIINTLNRGLDLARCKYLARMDCDDIRLPDRLAKQVAFMDAYPKIGICGTWVSTFGGNSEDEWKYSTNHNDIKVDLFTGSALAHPSVMMRLPMIRSASLYYDQRYPNAEDYKFWTEASNYMELANIPEILLRYRVHSNQLGQKNQTVQIEITDKIRMEQLNSLELEPSPAEFRLHIEIIRSTREFSIARLTEAGEWILGLAAANEKSEAFDISAFKKLLASLWWNTCWKSICAGYPVWKIYKEFPMYGWRNTSLREKVGFIRRGISHSLTNRKLLI